MQYAVRTRKTRDQVAYELGLSPKTIWNWFTGRRQPSKPVRERIERLNLPEREC
jgi:transcriptional regulator with XRE-family HTH domain